MAKVKLAKEVTEKYKFNGTATLYTHLGRDVRIDENLTVEKVDELIRTGFGHFEPKKQTKPKTSE